MPIRLTHVVDEATPEDGLHLLSLLLERLPAARMHQSVLVIGRKPELLEVTEHNSFQRIGRRFDWPLGSALDLQRGLTDGQPEVVHAWSAAAAGAVGAVWHGRSPVTVTISDPTEGTRSGRWWRSLQPYTAGPAIICSSSLIQRRLVEAGIPMDAATVIRAGVDFGAIRIAKQNMRRERLKLPADARVLVTPSPPSRNGGHYFAVWAVAILRQIWPSLRLLIPGASREGDRLGRLIGQIYCPEAFLLVGNRYSPAELLAVSDALLAPAIDDAATGWLAWAMAASVPIIGSAVPAIAELIADRQNGFLCKPAEPHTLATRIRTAFDSPAVMRQCVETARGQAYDVFRAQACVDQYLTLFENQSAGRSPLAGVRDTAVDA
ncbi:MAG: hypothetical protein AMXMBFR13_19230 [Phycisphaerae bacterium]